MLKLFLILFFSIVSAATPKVKVGADILFEKNSLLQLKGKKIGLITNHTAINSKMETTAALLKKYEKEGHYKIVAYFAPEHGIDGNNWAEVDVAKKEADDQIPVYSLYGASGVQRPNEQQLSDISLLIYDMQDIGSRSYTYTTTLFWMMEIAKKMGIPLLVLDRPNPINGLVVDGPMLDEKYRSAVGYINVPYCHGMTVGELAEFFNSEYHIHCALTVIGMKGWQRQMSFEDTGLTWIPTSPQIPEKETPFFYPMTGILGELQMVNIGVGYTLPFKLVGAPWIDANQFAEALNKQHYPGVTFIPFHYCPFFGRFAKEECHGVLIHVDDPKSYKPVSTQYLIIGLLKSLYPKKFEEALKASILRKDMFCKVNGTDEVYTLLSSTQPIAWKLRALHEKEREAFLVLRKKYLNPCYSKPTTPTILNEIPF